MLELLIGGAGTGKTDTVFHELTHLAEQESAPPLFLLVPEQFSFESEKTLLRRLGPRRASRVQVLSFTRLAQTVFRELGGVAGKRMDDGARVLLVSQAIREVTDHLTLYRRHAADPDYMQAVLAFLSECKQCGLSPDQLSKTSESLEEGTLKRKMHELGLIYGAYEALISQTEQIDPLDDLTVLSHRILESHLFDGVCLYVDGFKGFTYQEMQILGTLISRSKKTVVSLCTDTLTDNAEEAQEFGRFAPAIRTAARLRDLAREHHVPVAKARLLRENHRAADPALRFLEENAFLPAPAVFQEEAPAVAVVPCPNRETECRFAARTVRRILREEGGRCRDFTVVVRNLDDYQGLLEAAFEQEDLPCSIDRRDSILTDPIIVLLGAALRCVTGGWNSEDVFRLLKTGLSGFSPRSISLLENYVYQWRIRGSQWRQDWPWNPDGLSREMSPDSEKRLDHLNRLRRRIIRPLEALHRRLSQPLSGHDFALALYDYLEAAHTARMVRFQVARLDQAGEHALAERQSRLWDMTMELLDKFAFVLRDTVLPPARFADLFHLMAKMEDLGSIPQSLDAVQIGAADRIRFSSPKTVLILGANEGIFPAYPVSGGVLGDAERRRLMELGLPMADTSEWQTAEELFYAYTALAAPSHRLFVTYATSVKGESLTPSSLVETVRRILPGCSLLVPEDPEGWDVESEADAFDRLASKWGENSPSGAAFRQVFASQPSYQRRLQAMQRASAAQPHSFRDPAAARTFFGGHMRLSPSQVESYHRCRFAYFCRYGLHTKRRQPADLNAAEAGTLAHYVMEQLLPSYARDGFSAVDRPRINADTAAVVEGYVQTYMGGRDNKTKRLNHLLEQLTRTCSNLMWRVVRELEQSRFVPVDYELPIGDTDENGQGVPSLTLTLADGTQVQIRGTVDRVDLYRTGEADYVRVVDYKTGQREFRLSEVLEGLNLQMLIYLLSLWQNGDGRYGHVIRPAGVLYLPAKLPVVRLSRDADPPSLEREQLLTMKMNGLILDDPEIIQAMETDAAGLFIPARLDPKTGRPAKGSSIASLRQFGLLKIKIQKLLTSMAETLRRGDIAALPAGGAVDGCEYCDYRAVCGHEPDDPVRLIVRRDTAQILQELEKESPPTEET
mgnify:CR=1 FL=1